jgi:hypothetical protein
VSVEPAQPGPDGLVGSSTPAVRTPASVRIALFLFAVAFALPAAGLLSTRDSHDGFEIFGTFLLTGGAGCVLAFIAIICTLVGAGHPPRSGWTLFAIALSALCSLMLLALLMSLSH